MENNFKKLPTKDAKALSWLKKAISPKHPRRAMKNFNVKSDHLAATDGFRIHICTPVESLIDQTDSVVSLNFLRSEACLVEVEKIEDTFPEYKFINEPDDDKAIHIVLNKRYLMDALSAMSDTVVLCVRSKDKPIDVFGTLNKFTDVALYASIMPMRGFDVKTWKPVISSNEPSSSIPNNWRDAWQRKKTQ